MCYINLRFTYLLTNSSGGKVVHLYFSSLKVSRIQQQQEMLTISTGTSACLFTRQQ